MLGAEIKSQMQKSKELDVNDQMLGVRSMQNNVQENNYQNINSKQLKQILK